MQELLWARSGTSYPISTLCTSLQRNGYTLRRLREIAEKRDFDEEQNFIECFGRFPADYHIFLDETRKDPRGLNRRNGRGVQGTRTCAFVDFNRSTSYSGLGILTLDGMIDCSVTSVKGVKAELFLELIYHHLLPHLRPYPGPNSIVIMDNASIHHDPRVRQMIEAKGSRLVYLPPYANNLNPIEEAFSKAKLWLERHRGLAQRYPRWALGTALMSVSHTDAAGYMRHAGYRVQTLIPGLLYI